jgi:hypothetical protein
MAVDALKIIEEQLTYLQAISDKYLLTADQTVQLANLVKIRMLLKAKNATSDNDDPLAGISAEDLKSILEVLK